MTREQVWWIAFHPGDETGQPGLRLRWDAYQAWEHQFEAALQKLETEWSDWVTPHSAEASAHQTRKSHPASVPTNPPEA